MAAITVRWRGFNWYKEIPPFHADAFKFRLPFYMHLHEKVKINLDEKSWQNFNFGG